MSLASEQRNEILVIEDNPSFVHALRAIVHGRVFAVSRLEHGIRAIRGHRWDRIVLDLDLPDSRLEQTVAMLPAIKAASGDAPIVIMTGFAVNAAALIEAGAAVVIEKGDIAFADKLIAAL